MKWDRRALMRAPIAMAALACAAAAASPAVAQEPVAQEPATQDSEEGVGEIVVTARRHEENLQDTPISITAMSGDALQDRQITSTDGLDRIAPNLIVTQGQGVSGNSSAGSYFIRGIGQVDFLLNTDPGVALYVDGVYVARSLGSIMDLIDLERVEVLRGPQGTLFGRNTIGGAVSLVSRPPSDVFRADIRATVGSYDRHEFRASVSSPLADGVAGSIAMMWRERDGWVDRITDGSRLGDEESFAVRGALRIEPAEGLRFDLTADYLTSDGTSTPANIVQVVETANFPGFHNGALVGPPCVPPPGSLTNPACFNPQWVANDLYREQGTFNSRQELEVYGGALNASWQVSPEIMLRSITAYRRTDALGNRDGDHTPILIQNTTDTWTHEQFSQEFQLLGENFNRRLRWIIGAYYFTEQGENLNFVTFPVVAIQSGGSVDNRNYALFGQATLRITDRLSLTAGLRWTDETKRFLPDQVVLADPTGSFPPGSVPGFRLVPFVESSRSISEVTPMANLAYRWNDALMTYATYSEGFKSGGFTQRIFPPLPAPPPFDPEFATSYEVGFKWDLGGNRLRVNGAVYQTDYDNLQILVLEGVQPLTRNAGGARIRGFELELEAAPTPELRIRAGLGHVNADYTSLDPTVLVTGVTLASRFAQVPAWTGNLGVSYRIRLGDSGALTPRVDVAYRSSAYMDAANTPSLRQDAYALVNASIAFDSANGRWGVTLYGHNLTDQTYYTGGFADLTDQGYAEVLIGRPAEWGVTLNFSF